MITPEAAWSVVAEHIQPLAAVELPLEQSGGHVLAAPILADRDLPPADRSAMDGYAVRGADVQEAGAVLAICGEVAAGSLEAPRIEPGSCSRIFTGGNVPPGADTVVRIEDTEVNDGNGSPTVRILKPITPGIDIFRQGEDAARGDELLSPGSVLGPAAIGLCAATGYATVKVHPLPRVSVIATGEELLGVADTVGPHQLRDSNSPMLAAALAEAGFAVVRRESVRDNLEQITARIRAALADGDVVIVTGGVSVGKYDYGPEAIRNAGGTIRFHGVAMKPGKPQLFATTDSGKVIWGLPGNPVSAMTGYGQFIQPLLKRLAGAPIDACRPRLRVTIDRDAAARKGKHRYLPARVTVSESLPVAELLPNQGSADLATGARADGAVEVPAGAELEAGAAAWFTPWRGRS